MFETVIGILGKMRIGTFDLGKKVLVVAEIGNNHEGDFHVAEKLVREAASCGVNAVKFQTFRTEHYVSRSDAERFNRLKSFELTYSQFEQLSQLAHTLGLLFISTPLFGEITFLFNSKKYSWFKLLKVFDKKGKTKFMF